MGRRELAAEGDAETASAPPLAKMVRPQGLEPWTR